MYLVVITILFEGFLEHLLLLFLQSYMLFCVVKDFLFIEYDGQEVTSPVSESEEGYLYSTGGINLEQDEDAVSGMYVHMSYVPYSAKGWRGKTLANQLFHSFGQENIGKFKLLNFS